MYVNFLRNQILGSLQMSPKTIVSTVWYWIKPQERRISLRFHLCCGTRRKKTIHQSPFTGYTRLLYSVPMHQGFRWEVSRIHIKGSYFGSDTTAELDVEARYLGRSIFLDLLASLEMVFRSPTPQDWWLKKWIFPHKWIKVGFDPPPFRTKFKKKVFLCWLSLGK